MAGGELDLKFGRGFGLQAEVFFLRAFGSTDGGLETTATNRTQSFALNDPARQRHQRPPQKRPGFRMALGSNFFLILDMMSSG